MFNEINDHIALAIKEDLPNGDITSQCLSLAAKSGKARIIAKEDGVFYGSDVLQAVCTHIDPTLSVSLSIHNGQSFYTGQTIAHITGDYANILKAERIMLNFLQRLCGIASMANRFVTALNDPNINILDTRKTTPGYRYLEKEAVKAGGAHNHRLNLSDMVLIKENHLTAFEEEHGLDALEATLAKFKKENPNIKIEIEVETLDQCQNLPLHTVDYVMFDNFSIEQIQAGIDILNSRNVNAEIEVSGGITLKTIHLYRGLNIHRLSVGGLTHSVKACDLSLLFS
jgi:nicotinate-nucleotide pyrophosphorylase (carboxylating)